ncbi:membrane-bound lytic murein transglycosylase B [Malonomonas rubra DSM 5091]|uniref:Membrane-bound lytic murein transglycosylase B n=1 Tax=Malonomonas rubra DSM 5091 TaxID=1122189 RepID=A0A1M6BKM1_MALRU|nr:lytic murein transglycosylase [Malonomonas rubra]SHI49216.1 membrane-bound lytic murein transglycosylase B [Malonomonas rubra DSM 5091]
MTMRGFSFCLLLLAFTLLSKAQAASYDDWLTELRQEALSKGIEQATVEATLKQPELLDWVIEADRNQPEFKKTLQEYLDGALSQKRIDQGRQMLVKNRRLLNRIAGKYQVHPRFIVALWGIETYYGKHTGKVPIIDALVTLAFDGRRSAYFRQELFNALRIIDAGHIRPEKMKGSWAGAMGQVQFMPSSFLRFAVDGNGDGRIDLWDTPEDYLSSAANYLAASGWQKRRTWGREVRLPENFDSQFYGLEQRLPLARWQQLGIRRLDGRALPRFAMDASLIRPEGQDRAFLVYDNYRTLMKWNRAHSFAIAVGLLADEIGR